ncbi:MAG: NAD(P)-dependent glycerol-3-phosphate dehydrogenase [Rhodobacteraceae bacterium]|nr:NAD(P)-dependent glycerol-3-phosphate dehydrogenase [Paracoccaceae bacterium]
MTDRIAILGAGAFGTALALVMARAGRDVLLVAREETAAASMATARTTGARLPGHELPENIQITGTPAQINAADILLLAVPTQALSSALAGLTTLPKSLVACCKGIELNTGLGPSGIIARQAPDRTAAILTGPSFAVDLAEGMPTALTLATQSDEVGRALQNALSTSTLRLYRTTDVVGAELGGALKNVVALAAGITQGAGLGDSAQAAVIARGFAELQRFAVSRGALPETLGGLSGLGDLVLTCTSAKSRNYAAGLALGAGDTPDPNKTVEGLATAKAMSRIGASEDIDLPLISTVNAIAQGDISVASGIDQLLARPLRAE